MREYPHGLDEEILPEDLEVEQETIEELKEDLEQAIEEDDAVLINGLGEAHYFVACYSYALGESPSNIKPFLTKALEYNFLAFRLGIVLDVYEFIQLLSLARVLGNREIAEALARAKRSRYTDNDVEAEEVVFATAELLSALIVRDDETAAKILAANNPETIDAKKIYRYDRMIFFPLLQLLNAIYKNDENKFAAALQNRQKEFVDFFKRSDEKNDPEALIDIPGLAVLILAKQRGLSYTDASVYRPVGL